MNPTGAPPAPAPGGGSELAPYLAPAAQDGELDALAVRLGGEHVVYGASVEGRPLRALRLPATAAGAPRLLCGAMIHGVEWIAGQVALGLLRRLDLASAPDLRRRAELWVIPCINPDGRARTWEQRGHGRLPELRANARGVDLNRNFPLPPGASPSRLPGAGSTTPGAPTYRGPAPLSEPETAALARLLADLRPHAAANLHSFMGALIPASVRDRPTYAAYAALCRAFCAAQPGPRYRRLASRHLDVYTGEQEDHQHHALDGWAICVETFTLAASFRQHLRAPSLFWRFNPRDPAPWVTSDVTGLFAYFNAALALPRPSELTGGGGRALSPRRAS